LFGFALVTSALLLWELQDRRHGDREPKDIPGA
jgi:hypothetical protein